MRDRRNLIQNAFEITVAAGLLGAAFLILLWPLLVGGVIAAAFGWWPWGLLAGAGLAAVWFPGMLSGLLIGRTGQSSFRATKSFGWWLSSVSSSAAFGAVGAVMFAVVRRAIDKI